jgi:long-chain acyl-CoA synthetase
MRKMIHGAAPCPLEIKRQMLDWWGPVVTEYYAATEGGGTAISGDEWLRKPGSVGRPWPGSIIKVFNGTVYMKMGDSNFEYHKDKAKTEKARVAICSPSAISVISMRTVTCSCTSARPT